MALWRQVLARLILDYLGNCPAAARHLHGQPMDYVCNNVGFDADRTRRAVILAKMHLDRSGLRLKHWLKQQYEKKIRRKAKERHRHRTENLHLKRLLAHQRLSEVCPDLVGYLKRNKNDYLTWSERRENAPRYERHVEQQKVREFFEVFWGKGGAA